MTKLEEFLIEKIDELEMDIKDSMNFKGIYGNGYEAIKYKYPENYEVKVEEWLNQVRNGIDDLK